MDQPQSPINVYSEYGKLKTVLVHRPGKELEWITNENKKSLLFSAILDVKRAQKEHDEFVKILKNQGVNVVYVKDLFIETWNACETTTKKNLLRLMINNTIRQAYVDDNKLQQKIFQYLYTQKPDFIFDSLVGGISSYDLGISKEHDLLVTRPLPNMYFTRDPFASLGNGVIINKMKYPIRRAETLFAHFIFTHHPVYKNTIMYSKYNDPDYISIEGGDIFVYNKETLVIGNSERTTKRTILRLAKKIRQTQSSTFKHIYVVRVPKDPTLMHLDTWLTMVGPKTFIYSANIQSDLEFYHISLTQKPTLSKPCKGNLSYILEQIIGTKPVLVPVAGNYSKIQIDRETTFDATNFLAIAPNVVVGYDRNTKTIEALKKARVKVYTFDGSQLSLGMGSTRCMTMPLERESIEK